MRDLRRLSISIFVLIALACLVWFAYVRTTKTLPLDPLVLGYSEGIPDIPALIAAENGYFRDEGLDVRYRKFAVGKLALEALLRGEVDVATTADTPIVLQSLRRRDFVVIGQFVHFTAIDLLTRKETGIHSAADLRGHRVGVMIGTSAQFFLETLLADNGLRPVDITEVDVPAVDSVNALAQGRVDAVAAFVPAGHYAQIALGDRAQVVPYDKVRYRESFNYVVKRDFPQKRPLAAQGLLRATNRAIEWARANRAEAIAIVTRRSQMEEKVVASLWDEYRLALGLDQALLGSLESQARWAVRNGVAEAALVPNYLDFLDMSPLLAVAPKTVTVIR
ncbi:MAG: transporter substrate-binding protein [Rhodocyclales bacterium]|nr:transporter substrate-binding protein [Rhodocyclales bacterium]